jgi:hypothetical protein
VSSTQPTSADVGRRARVVEHLQQLVDRVRAERVEHVGPVERDPHGAVRAGAVVGDVGEVLEAGHLVPGGRVEGLGHTGERTHGREATGGRLQGARRESVTPA